MAQNDNALKAPAHGFGQEVSFSFQQDPRDVPVLEPAGVQAARAGVHGSPVAGRVQEVANVAPLQENATMKLLSKAVNAAMAPRIKEARAAAFVAGMQRAATGEAIQDIAADQPWYTKIFGESDVIEGARVYTAQAKAAEATAAIEDSMEEVRKLGPEAANDYYKQLVAKHMTGDDIADASIMQGFARTLPATMRRQAKEHYKWRQEEASSAESRAFMTNATLLQKRGASGVQNDDEYAANAVQFFASMRPAQGRDLDSWQKARTADLLNLAQSGQFHAVNVIRNSGLLDQLNADQRTKIESALDTSENRTIANKSFEYADEIGRIAGQSQVWSQDLDPETTRLQIVALNERFRKETGIDRDLVTLAKGSEIIKDVHATLLREGERRQRDAETRIAAAEKDNDKARAEQIKADSIRGLLSIGQFGLAKRHYSDGEVDKAHVEAWKAQPTAEHRARFLVSTYTGNGNYDGALNGAIKHMLETRSAALIGQPATPEFAQAYAEWKVMHEANPIVAEAYHGKVADRFALYDQLRVPGNGPVDVAAYTAAFSGMDPPKPRSLTTKEQSALPAEVSKLGRSTLSKVFGGARMSPDVGQAEQYAEVLEPYVKRQLAIPGRTLEHATTAAAEALRRETGSEMLGGFFVRGDRDTKPLLDILRTYRDGDSSTGKHMPGQEPPADSAQVWDETMKAFVYEVAKQHGVSRKTSLNPLRGEYLDAQASLYRGADVQGTAQLLLVFTKPDGSVVTVPTDSDEIKSYQQSGRVSKIVRGTVTQSK